MFCLATAKPGNAPSGVPKGRHLPGTEGGKEWVKLRARVLAGVKRKSRDSSPVARNDRNKKPTAGWKTGSG